MASTVQQSEMSAGEIVLGLLVERPDTCYQLDKRMAERLGSAQFSRGAAAGAVKRLQERDLVRPVDREERTDLRVVDGRRKTLYEPTPAGVEHFRRWLRASTQTPPVREELHAKIAFWGSRRPAAADRDRPRGRDGLRAAAAGPESADATERRGADASEWARTMRLIAMTGEVMWWDARIKWLQDVRLYLERAVRASTGRGRLGGVGRRRCGDGADSGVAGSCG